MNDTENNWEERLKCVGCCQGDYCAGKAGEHDEELKSFLRAEIAKAYEAGQVEMGKWVLYENTGGRAGIQNKIEDIAAALKAKTDI